MTYSDEEILRRLRLGEELRLTDANEPWCKGVQRRSERLFWETWAPYVQTPELPVSSLHASQGHFVNAGVEGQQGNRSKACEGNPQGAPLPAGASCIPGCHDVDGKRIHSAALASGREPRRDAKA
ncbi:MAG: hypothetical protein OXO50_13940 [Caldilineaceae bacterium]|nr:hypothetical protein [Caldilineaceae bacterium]